MTLTHKTYAADRDAALLFAGLNDLPPDARAAAERRLIEELQASVARRREEATRVEKVLAAVIEIIDADAAGPE